MQDSALSGCLEGFQDDICGSLRFCDGHTTKTDEDRRVPRFNKGLQVRGRFPALVFGGPITGQVDVLAPIDGAGYYISAEPVQDGDIGSSKLVRITPYR